MRSQPPIAATGALSRLAELAEEETRHRRLLRLGLVAAVSFHLGLLLLPLPQRDVAVAEREVAPVLHLVPIPPFSPPPPPDTVRVQRPRRAIPVPEVLLPEPVGESHEIAVPLVDEPGFIDDIAPPPPPAPEPEGPLHVGGPIAQPARLAYVEPVYPPAALKARLPGVVILRVLLGRDGGVREVTVLRPATMGMTESAVEAVRQWRWEPALLDGRPVEVLMTVTVTFTVR